MRKFVLYGGSFDPVHNGHLRIARAASLKLNADVIFIPARSPRWKECQASAEDRVKMLKLVLRSYAPSGSRLSTYEIESSGVENHTIDTVRYFIKKYPKAKFYLLIGGDQVNRFYDWIEAETLAKLVTIVYVPRSGITLDQNVIEHFKMENLEYYESGDVSSSAVREGSNLDVPFEVRKYIEKHQLYYIDTLKKYVDQKRLLHSIEVAKLSYEIAVVNKLENPSKYYFAGLFHDVGKIANYGKINPDEVMKKYYPEYLDIPRFAHHQFIGEYIAKTELGITDPDILETIKFHCTGKANMSKLAMVVYASDKIEPTRQFDSRFLINSCMRNWYQGFIDTLTDNRKYLLAHAKDIENRLTAECFKMYLEENHG